jgi:hypothetical protein
MVIQAYSAGAAAAAATAAAAACTEGEPHVRPLRAVILFIEDVERRCIVTLGDAA